mmetsp:Transcript_36074/g.83707  ORF Transcript_36074/g.83707 Transcript_36074/m.83707 type:complete len:148 (+) Transcript_36074:255-698(+)
MLKALRDLDRTFNYAHYPRLVYPEVYIMNGGYKAFWEAEIFSSLCVPSAYVPMRQKEFKRECGENMKRRCSRSRSRSLANSKRLDMSNHGHLGKRRSTHRSPAKSPSALSPSMSRFRGSHHSIFDNFQANASLQRQSHHQHFSHHNY